MTLKICSYLNESGTNSRVIISILPLSVFEVYPVYITRHDIIDKGKKLSWI